jgi:hypothetical protein
MLRFILYYFVLISINFLLHSLSFVTFQRNPIHNLISNGITKNKILEPFIESRNLLFKYNYLYGLKGRNDKDQLDYILSLQFDLLSGEVAEIIDNNDTVEVVEKFKFHIKSEDLVRAQTYKSNLNATNDKNEYVGEKLIIDNNIVELLENAEKFEENGKITYRIKMDYDELMSNLSREESSRTIYEEVIEKKNLISSGRDKIIKYNETLYRDANSEINLNMKKLLPNSELSFLNKPLKLSIAEFNPTDIAENIIGTLFVGTLLTLSIFITHYLAQFVYMCIIKTFKLAMRTIPIKLIRNLFSKSINY